MEITSGGTPGRAFADEWAPLDNNVHGALPRLDPGLPQA
jgi:hypothetical protein